MMFGDEKRFGTNLKAVANGSTIFAFGKPLDSPHVGPGSYFSTTKENIRYCLSISLFWNLFKYLTLSFVVVSGLDGTRKDSNIVNRLEPFTVPMQHHPIIPTPA